MLTSKKKNAFFSKSKLDAGTGCLEWQRCLDKDGYGKLVFKGKSYQAHRFSWIVTYGDIPEGQCVCHKCDNPRCINPDHLFLGTHSENIQDAVDKKRMVPCFQYRPKRTNTKLDVSQIAEIRKLYAEKQLSHRQLAKMFGVCRSNIHYILSKKYWEEI